jgi:hypothetical protein
MSFEAFISSHSKGSDGFIETARRVAGNNPPQWLAKHFQRWSSSVMLDGNVHTKQFGKAEARVRLKALSDAVALVDRELQDPAVIQLLLADQFGPMPNLAGVDAVLAEIRRRANVASSQLNLLGTGLDERLENLSDGAKLVAREFRDPALSEFLKAEQIIGPPPPTKELGALLREIRRQADAALLSPSLANKAGKTKAGRSRALPPDASSAPAFCAAVILEAWAYFHNGEYPLDDDPRIADAAEEYWRACGGTTNSWSDNPLNAWRPYFKKAREDSLARIREKLREHLAASSAHNH